MKPIRRRTGRTTAARGRKEKNIVPCVLLVLGLAAPIPVLVVFLAAARAGTRSDWDDS